jgi:MFS family permease
MVMRAVSAPGVSSSSFPPSSVSPSTYVRVETDALSARRTGGFDRQAAVRSALNAGAVAGILSLLPLGLIVGPPLAGFLSVRLYRRRSSVQELSTGAGFKLGALCGAFGFAIFAALGAVIMLASQNQDKFRETVNQAVRHAQARYTDYQAQWLDYFTTPQGLIVMAILLSFFFCVAFVLLSGLGGAISAARVRRKGPPA